MTEYLHVIITSEEEQSNNLVYSSKKKGVIKVHYLSQDDRIVEYKNFTQEQLLALIKEHQEYGYFITSYVATGRSPKPGINLNSTIVMVKKVAE